MNAVRARGSELRQTARLATPLILATAGNQLLSVVDVLIAGRMGEQVLAAAGFGQSIFFLVSIFPMGVILGLDTLVSQAIGHGDRAATHLHFASALRLARWMSLPTLAVMAGLLAVSLRFVDFSPHTERETWAYLAARAPSTWPFLVFMAQRSLLQGWGRARPVATSMLVANLVNLPVSALLAMGDGALTWAGLPSIGLGSGLGAAGIGLGTTIVVLCQLGWLTLAVSRLDGQPPTRDRHPPVGELWRLGWPIALQLGSETSIFAGTTILMGYFGEAAVAAHRVALTVTAMTITVCLGIGSATAVRVGMAVGAGALPRARRATLSGLGLGLTAMLCSATAFVLAGPSIAGLFTDVPELIEMAAGFLFIAAMFQLLDGSQIIASAALRGAGRTREAMIVGLVGYWVLGLPFAVGLALGTDLGPSSLWYGLVVGLTFSGPVATLCALTATKVESRQLPVTPQPPLDRREGPVSLPVE
ncbi:MATE family efflux transporter [Haliangium sp.]|uniref:MATE family efflux transporter n=1 Tax=Haliangium sp. TaxID=2663208 RepID=UPI003D0B8074